MEFLNDPVQLVRRFHAFVYGPDVPPEAAEKLQSIPGSAADVISQGREILYAHYDLLNDEGKAVVAQLAQYAVAQGWGGDNADNRCGQMVALARHDVGEIATKPSLANTPDPNAALRDDNTDWKKPLEAEPPTK